MSSQNSAAVSLIPTTTIHRFGALFHAIWRVNASKQYDSRWKDAEINADPHDLWVQQTLEAAFPQYIGVRTFTKKVNGEPVEYEAVGIDILNLPYELLSLRWQAANTNAADFALRTVAAGAVDGKISKAQLEVMAEAVHINWASSNSWETLASVAYADLIEVEKQKDRVQIEQAASLLRVDIVE